MLLTKPLGFVTRVGRQKFISVESERHIFHKLVFIGAAGASSSVRPRLRHGLHVIAQHAPPLKAEWSERPPSLTDVHPGSSTDRDADRCLRFVGALSMKMLSAAC